MFCPICKGEFREGFEECSICNINLVADLENITEQVNGEFKLCVACEIESAPDTTRCQKCGMKLIRAILHDDTYVFLEEPPKNAVNEDLIPDYEGELINELEFYREIPDEEAVVLIESEDLPLLIKVQELLNENEICFQFRAPEEIPGALGNIFGGGSVLERSFPKVIVYQKDEERALELVGNHPGLGLAELPAELLESEEDSSDEDSEYDDYENDDDDDDNDNDEEDKS